ncbi:hypothetical protein BDV95DRAFT_106920 [Massariosphaeria phaeospora]|uniref:Uncharacterized protein n=1 Tax=Massariosphaeria phaeospora TaxID=100035 RepID=A0A7C8I5X5_9PLEO|nr:hypothetical protein BDV95DRAFT_106920 [Massariosphaeria phaeospora]
MRTPRNTKTPIIWIQMVFKLETAREATTATALLKFEVETTATTATWEAPRTTTTLPEMELLVTERRALERITLLLGTIGVIAVVEALFEFGIGEDLVGFVDGGHLLLGFLWGKAICRSLIWVIHLRKFAVSLFDFTLVGVAGYA